MEHIFDEEELKTMFEKIKVSLQQVSDNERKRIQALKVELAIIHPFWSYILLNCELKEVEIYPTYGGTDGYKTILYCPLLTSRLSYEELKSFFLHECLHILLLTTQRRELRDVRLWNISADIIINHLLMEMGYKLPQGSITASEIPILKEYSKKITTMAAEEIYDILFTAERKEGKLKINLSLPIGRYNMQDLAASDENTNKPADADTNKPADEDTNKPEDAEGQSGGGPKQIINEPFSGIEPFKDCEFVGPTDAHLKHPPGISEEDITEHKHNLAVAAYEIWSKSSVKGDLPEGLLRYLRRLREPKIPWTRYLHTYVAEAYSKDDYTRFPPSRRYLAIDPDLHMYHLYKLSKIGLMVISIDTSGSISDDLLTQFLSEVKKLVTYSEEVLIITSDAEIYDIVKTQDVDKFLSKLKVRGGGGTDHRPVFEYLKKEKLIPTVFIGLTDLFTDLPPEKPPFPVIWCVPEGNHGKAPWGLVIEIPAEDSAEDPYVIEIPEEFEDSV